MQTYKTLQIKEATFNRLVSFKLQLAFDNKKSKSTTDALEALLDSFESREG